MTNEPISLLNSIKDLIRFGLLFAAGMGWIAMTPDQQEQFLLLIAAFGLVVDQLVTWYTRSQVAPMRRFRPKVQKAINEGKHEDVRAPAVHAPHKPVAPPVDHYAGES